MATTVSPETTPQDGSLESAAQRMTGLLSLGEDTKADPAQPEQAPKKTAASESTAGAAAPEAEKSATESEPTPSEVEEDVDPEPPLQPRTFKVKVAGREVEVTEDELRSGYSRTEDYTRKTQQLADERRAFEEREVGAVRAEREQYKTYLGELKAEIQRITPVEPNWEKLRNEVTPDVFAAELLAWQQRQKQIEKIGAEEQRVKSSQEDDARKGFERHVADEREKLEAILPDLKDPEKGKVLSTDLAGFAIEMGFTKQQLELVTDHRVVLLLHKAMLHDRAEKQAPKIQNKIERALETSPPGSRTSAAKPDKLNAAKQRLKQSGSLDDAASAITHLL